MTEAEFEFSDTSAMTCLLCARQFKSLDQLKRHNKESDLHKKNFKDTNLRDIAREKAKAARAKAEQQQPKYRDRASERRVMHNQPDVPRPTPEVRPLNKRKQSEGPRAPSPPPPAPPAPAQDDKNIGNKLLKMMGWKEGQGLGTEGEGRVDPVYGVLIGVVYMRGVLMFLSRQTAIYAAGAGLGASKAKDISKIANDYSGYVNLAKDAVSLLSKLSPLDSCSLMGTGSRAVRELSQSFGSRAAAFLPHYVSCTSPLATSYLHLFSVDFT